MDVKKHLTPEQLDLAKKAFEKYDQMCDLYLENAEFKEYVDKYCKQNRLHKDIALLHKLVQSVGDEYIRRDGLKEKDICPIPQYSDELPDDKSC